MAGPTIASAEVDVDFDGGRLPAQARRMAKQASKQLESGLIPETRRIGAAAGDALGDGLNSRMGSAGRDAADGFSRGFMVGSDGLAREVETQFRGHDQFFWAQGDQSGREFGRGFTSSMGDSDYGKELARYIGPVIIDAVEEVGEDSGHSFGRGFTSGVGDSDFSGAVERRTSRDLVPSFERLGRDAGESFTEFTFREINQNADKLTGGPKLRERLRKSWGSIGKDSSRSFLGRMEAGFSGGAGRVGRAAGDAFSRGFHNNVLTGMDRTVRAVLIAISLIGPQIAALGSGLSASLVALLSSAIVGLGGSLLALGGPLAAALTGSIVLATQWGKMVKQSAELKGAIGGLSGEWKSQMAAFRGAATGGITEVVSALSGALAKVDLGAGLGKAISSIASSFAAVISSPGFQQFMQAMSTTFPQAFASLGAGLAGLFSGLTTLFTAAAPAAKTLADSFQQWGEGFARVMEEMAGSGQLTAFFDAAVTSLGALNGFLGPLSRALGNVFLIGSETGNRMLETLGELARQFLEFTQSLGGQHALRTWFEQGEQIFNALLPVIGAFSTALADMVTPAVVASLKLFLADLAEIIPVLGQLLSVIGNVGILEIFSGLLNGIGQAIAPVIPALMQLAGTLGGALMEIVVALQPLFNALGDVIAQIIPIVTPLISQLAGALAPILAELGPLLTSLAAAFMPILQVVADVAGQLLAALMPAILALVQAVAALAPGLVSLFVAFNPVLRVITLLIPILMPVIELLAKLITWIANLISQLAPFINKIAQVVAAFVAFKGSANTVVNVLGKVGKFFASTAAKVGKFVSSMVSKVIAFFTRMGGSVGSTTAKLVSNVVKFFAQLPGKVGAFVVRMVTNVVKFFTQLFSRLTSATSSGIAKVVGFFLQLPNKVMNGVGQLIARMASWAANLFSKLGSSFSTGVTTLVKWFIDMPNRIVNALAGAASLLVGIGGDIMSGLLSGLTAGFKKVTDWVSGAASSISGGFKKILGISSPSKVFIKIGEDTAAGFVIGFRRAASHGKSSFQQVTQSSIKGLVDGFAKGSAEVGKEAGRLIAKVNDLQISALKANERALKNAIKSVNKADLGAAKTKATIRDLTAQYGAYHDSIKRSGESIRQTIRTNSKELTGALKEYENSVKQLDKAREKLKDLKKEYQDLRSSVKDSVVGQFDLGSLVSTEEGAGPVTFASVAAYVSGMKAKAKKFSSKMKELVAKGLPPAFVQQLAQLGLDGAIEVADALLTGSPAELQKLGQDYAAFETAAGSIGKTTAEAMYRAGLDAQQGLIDGLVEDTKELRKGAKKLANALVKYVKQALGIKSPSRVFRTIGELTMAGLAKGIERGTGGALKAARDAVSLVGGVSANSGLSAPSLGGGRYVTTGGGASRNITIAEGAIQVITPLSDARLVASQMLDRMVTRIR